MSQPITLTDAVAFIAQHATADDLDQVYAAAKQRTRTLRTIAAAAAASLPVGASVRLDGLSPKYLNGLTGVLKSTTGGRAVVTLDKESTSLLGFSSRRFYAAAGKDSYDLGGLPLSTVHPA